MNISNHRCQINKNIIIKHGADIPAGSRYIEDYNELFFYPARMKQYQGSTLFCFPKSKQIICLLEGRVR
jgi:hypothetical protein